MSPAVETVRIAWKRASERNAPLLAAGVAFYAFLSIFPAMIAAVLAYGLLASPQTVQRQSDRIADALPADAASVVTGQLEGLTSTGGGSLGVGLVVAILAGLYSASSGTANLLTALRAMFDEKSSPGFLKAKIESLGITAGAVVLGLVLIALVAAAPAVLDALDLPGFARAGIEAGRWLLLVAALAAGITVLFRFAHSPLDEGHRDLKLGVAVATGLWVVVSVGFSLYVDQFGSYGKTYGALAGVVALLLWLWIGIYALLLGASVEAANEAEGAGVIED